MLYRIARGGVEHYRDGQSSLVYLVSTIGDVVHAGIRWVFSEGNCGAVMTGYYDDLDQLDSKVDWPLQRETMWYSTADDPTRETRRAAEFLVYQVMPWRLIRWLVVRSDEMAVTVRALLAKSGGGRQVVVRPDWYYNGGSYN